jgi:hypothetical protein
MPKTTDAPPAGFMTDHAAAIERPLWQAAGFLSDAGGALVVHLDRPAPRPSEALTRLAALGHNLTLLTAIVTATAEDVAHLAAAPAETLRHEDGEQPGRMCAAAAADIEGAAVMLAAAQQRFARAVGRLAHVHHVPPPEPTAAEPGAHRAAPVPAGVSELLGTDHRV